MHGRNHTRYGSDPNLASLPSGGIVDQVLAKQSNNDYDADWVDTASSGALETTDGVTTVDPTETLEIGDGLVLTNPATNVAHIALEGAIEPYDEQVLSEASLAYYWPLDDASGDAVDHGTNGLDLAAGGTPTYGEPGPFGATPTSVLFDSGNQTNGNLSLVDRFHDNTSSSPYPYNFLLLAPYTFEAVIYPTSLPSNQGPILFIGNFATGGHKGLIIFSDGHLYTYRDSMSALGSASVIPLNVWTHVAVTYDGSTVRLYVNGILDASVANTTNAINPTSPLLLGYASNFPGTGTEGFLGRIGQVAVYTSALSAATLYAHANAGILTDIRLANVRSVSSAYTIGASDDIVLVTGTTTVTLPTAVGQPGRRITVKNAGTNTVTVARTGGENIDASASNISLSTAKQAREFTSNGSSWWITAAYL